MIDTETKFSDRGFVKDEIGDLPFEIAERFNLMANPKKSGWYQAQISYMVDEAGNIELIDEIKVVFTGTKDLIGIRRQPRRKRIRSRNG